MAVTPNSIITTQATQSSVAACTTANSTYTTAPTNSVLVCTAGPNGARVTKLRAIPTVTVAATQLQEFRDAGSAGASKYFSNSALMAAYTMAQSTQAPVTDFGYSDGAPKKLQPNERLYVAIGVSNAVNFECEWENF